jgi:flagellar basal-body rod modification protein FlgD
MRVDLSNLGNNPTPTANGGQIVGQKDEFLRLFVAQLQHQNPLDPQDGADFVAQLAQFTAVEQAASSNDLLGTIAANQASSAHTELFGLVGHDVEAVANTVTLAPEGGARQPLTLNLDSAATSVKVTVKDASGRVVRELDLGARGAGRSSLGWDGTGPNGTELPSGDYTIEIEATGAGGAKVGAEARVSGRVDGVEFGANGAVLRAGGYNLSPANIVRVG